MKNKDIEEWVHALLQPNGAFDPAKTRAEKFVNEVRADILSEDDPDMVEIRTAELRTAVAAMVYGAHDPKTVPNDVIKFAVRNPPEQYAIFINVEARGRVKNANTGIRAYCMECQGNDRVAVRQCPSINCPLWSFRLGGNPFYGRLVGSTGEEETDETEAELLGLEEDENNANSET